MRSSKTWLAVMLALSLLLAACGRNQPVSEGQVSVRVGIDAAQLAPMGLSPQGSPTDTNGAVATTTVAVQVFDRHNNLVRFSASGSGYVVDPSGGIDTLNLSAAAPSAEITLMASGNPHTFEAHGYRAAGQPVVTYANQQSYVGASANVLLTLRSVLGEAVLLPRYPAAFATPGADPFDLMLVVTANGYDDLNDDYLLVPLGDFTVAYGTVTGASVISSSTRGMRLAIDAACVGGVSVAAGTVSGLVWNGTEVVSGNVVLPQYALDCPSATGGVQTDLVNPVVTLAYDAGSLVATGTAEDPNGMITRVEIWDGPALIAATGGTGGVPDIMFAPGTDQFSAQLTTAPVGGLVALAYDAAGNIGYSEETVSGFSVWVQQGASGDGSQANPFGAIQAAIDAVAAGGTVYVLPGQYLENVSVSKSVRLLSTDGRDVTSIVGNAAVAGNAPVVVPSGVNDVQIGDIGAGFTIVGLDGPPGNEFAAVYFPGQHYNMVVRGNNLVANGDTALLTDYDGTNIGSMVVGMDVSYNIISGHTFIGTTVGWGDQFTIANVPRPLVTINYGSIDVSFTNNVITGVSGGLDAGGVPRGNQLVMLDAHDAVITDNTFAGETYGTAATLRVRRPSAVVQGNSFGGVAAAHLVLLNNPLTEALIQANTFNGGIWFTSGGTGTVATALPAAFGAEFDNIAVGVLPGSYSLSAPLQIAASNFALRGPNHGVALGGARGAEAIFSGATVVGAGNVSISGLAFEQPAAVSGGDLVSVYLGNGANNVTIDSNVFSSAGRVGRGVINESGVAATVTLQNNSFSNYTSGVFANAGANYTVQSNLFENNEAGVGSDSSTVVVAGNTFTGNLEGVGLGVSGMTVTGNQFNGAEAAYVVDYPGTYDLGAVQAANNFSPAAVVGVFVPGWNTSLSFNALVPQ